MLMAVNEPYALMVQPDDILISPREVDEHFGTMVCFHPRYALGDHHNHMDKDDFLREMYLDTVGHDEAGMKRYERMVNIVSSRFRHGPKTEERAIDEAMQKVISEKYLMLPLYLYDHSGLAMSTESFSGRAPHAEWDSGQVGWIYVSKEDALKEFDADKMTGAIRQKADALMRSEVAAYDSYLRGECYGFELYKNGELSDSCWGFMGNFSDVLKDMAAYLPDECKGMVDHLEEQEQNIGSIYELQGFSELHYYLKVEHVFTPAEVEALLSFQDPLDVARWCWEENNHEHSFPICDLLKEIDAAQKFEHFTSEPSAQDKYTLLMKRLGQNYFAYRESLMSKDKESLIEKAAEITAMQEAYSYLTTKFEFGDEMLDDVLALENPLKYFADRWLLPVSDVFDVDMDIRENIAGIRDSQEYLCQRGPAVSVLARLQNAAQEVRECPAAEKAVRDFGAR